MKIVFDPLKTNSANYYFFSAFLFLRKYLLHLPTQSHRTEQDRTTKELQIMLPATPAYTLKAEAISVAPEGLFCAIGGGQSSDLVLSDYNEFRSLLRRSERASVAGFFCVNGISNIIK